MPSTERSKTARWRKSLKLGPVQIEVCNSTSCDANFVDCRAVIWDHSDVPRDLNDTKGNYSARLESAKDINDKGEITGRAIDASNVRTAYLAVPREN